jgi:transposase
MAMNTVKQVRGQDKLTVTAGERLYVGVDVHKHTFHVAVWSQERGVVKTWAQPGDGRILMEALTPVRGHITEVVYEAGPTGFGLARALTAEGYSVRVIAPSKIPALPGRQAKTDRLDCIKPAPHAAGPRAHRGVCIPTEQEEADRQLTRLREQISRKVRRVKVQIKSFLLMHGIAEPPGLANWSVAAVKGLRELALREELRFALDLLLEDLDAMNALLRKAGARVKTLAESGRYQAHVKLLRTEPGTGLLTAMIYLTQLYQPGRFEEGIEVACFTGLAPGVSKSGLTERGGPLLKTGNARLRTVMVEASWRSIRLDPALRQRYQRLLRNTGNVKKAISGVARWRSICMWRMLTRNEPYRLHAA